MEHTTEIASLEQGNSGKVSFANEVIATIAALAASEVEGIASMSGGFAEGLTEMLGRKNLTKGVKVEVGTEEAAVDISVVVKYGCKIQCVAAQIQQNVKSAIETMTGLRVVEVNVNIAGIAIEKEPKEQPAKESKEEAPAEPEQPSGRVR